MSDNPMEEWFLKVPWGKMAMLSCGAPSLPPVLLVHGFVDTAATFLPLMAAMPPHYHYVAFDLPGHGRSDTMPGPPFSYMHLVEVIRQIVEQLRWDTFYCIAHSLGYLISAFYNAAFPGRIRRLVTIAGTISIPFNGLFVIQHKWFELCYHNYYQRYCKPLTPTTYTYEEAVESLADAWHVSEEHAGVLATRCLETVDGRVRFTWDKKAKKIVMAPVSADMIYAALSTATPTLCLIPDADQTPVPFSTYHEDMTARLRALERSSEHFKMLDVEGGHSVHLTNPERVVHHIVKFFNETKSKL